MSIVLFDDGMSSPAGSIYPACGKLEILPVYSDIAGVERKAKLLRPCHGNCELLRWR